MVVEICGTPLPQKKGKSEIPSKEDKWKKEEEEDPREASR